jgi:hypothetical protein
MVVVNSCLCGFRRPKSNACTWSRESSNQNLLRWSCTWKHKAHALMHNPGTAQIKEYKWKEGTQQLGNTSSIRSFSMSLGYMFLLRELNMYVWYRELLNRKRICICFICIYIFAKGERPWGLLASIWDGEVASQGSSLSSTLIKMSLGVPPLLVSFFYIC